MCVGGEHNSVEILSGRKWQRSKSDSITHTNNLSLSLSLSLSLTHTHTQTHKHTNTRTHEHQVRESNARVVRWSDGTMSLYLGSEIFDIHKQLLQGEFSHLFVRQGLVCVCLCVCVRERESSISSKHCPHS